MLYNFFISVPESREVLIIRIKCAFELIQQNENLLNVRSIIQRAYFSLNIENEAFQMEQHL